MRFGDEIHEKNKALNPHKTKVRFKISGASNPVIKAARLLLEFLEMQGHQIRIYQKIKLGRHVVLHFRFLNNNKNDSCCLSLSKGGQVPRFWKLWQCVCKAASGHGL